MNNVDKQYLKLMAEVLYKGNTKHTRAGDALSLFGKTMEFDLREGFPLLTTRKVPFKGMIHELLWFLKGNTNIKYLVDNNVHIWDDDAYRWFKSLDFKSYKVEDPEYIEGMYKLDRCVFELDELQCSYDLWGKAGEFSATEFSYLGSYSEEDLKNLTKEEFIDFTKRGVLLRRTFIFEDRKLLNTAKVIYTFGDLGPVYGKQWRGFGIREVDQIKNVIEKLKTNPDDRRMLVSAYNPDVLDEVALPPCHVMFQFYTRELSRTERNVILQGHNPNRELTMEELDEMDIPKLGLSISFSMRSTDIPLGLVWNIPSYALLCNIIANICNMVPDKLIYFGGDVHIYANQMDGCKEQLERKGSDTLPQLIMKRKFENIDEINYDDFEIVDYNPDPVIKFPLSVG